MVTVEAESELEPLLGFLCLTRRVPCPARVAVCQDIATTS